MIERGFEAVIIEGTVEDTYAFDQTHRHHAGRLLQFCTIFMSRVFISAIAPSILNNNPVRPAPFLSLS